jgi:hypothetical protein
MLLLPKLNFVPPYTRAGKRALIAYNSASSPIPASSGPLLAHVGYDGWWNKVSKVVELTQMTAADAASYGLQQGGGKTTWWSGLVDVPLSAAVLDFVFSNKERSAWDNNKNKDFHTTVLGGSWSLNMNPVGLVLSTFRAIIISIGTSLLT